MRPTQTPHRTPLRRVSQGSLYRLSRSGAYPDAPHGLGFLEPALSEFLDETEALQTNVEGLKNLSDSLATFNESFASWLYVMNMNALTTDWPQVRKGFNTSIEVVMYYLTTKWTSGTNRCFVHPCQKACR
jgi:DASH complex subunit DAM1